jgi:hypothetical protein
MLDSEAVLSYRYLSDGRNAAASTALNNSWPHKYAIGGDDDLSRYEPTEADGVGGLSSVRHSDGRLKVGDGIG